MIARVLLVGEELLAGVISDRNVATIARSLGPLGVSIDRVEVVGDDVAEIAAAARRLADGAELLFVTGGLGPTTDDVTRDGMAAALEVEMAGDFAAGPQATFPAGTTQVPNPVGSAPGFHGQLLGARFWVLPGVPLEAAEMILPIASEIRLASGDHDWERVIATVGQGETVVAREIDRQGFAPPPGVALAYLPYGGGVRLRLYANGGCEKGVLDQAAAQLRLIVGEWALSETTLASSLVAEFAARGQTLAVAESCTGGLIGARVTDVPGSSIAFRGALVAYANEAKVAGLGVTETLLEHDGAVSERVAEAMARGARDSFDATVAVSVTGIAGPDGGTPDKPVGTVWVGIAHGEGVYAKHFLFRGNRAMIRERTVNKALEIAYRQGQASGA